MTVKNILPWCASKPQDLQLYDISFVGEEDNQLSQTIDALRALTEFGLNIDKRVLMERIELYADAAVKIAELKESAGNPIAAVVK